MSFAVNLQVRCFGTVNVALQSLNPVSRRLKLKQEKINPPMFVKWSFPLIADGCLVPSLLESKCLPAPFRVAALLTQENYFLLSSIFLPILLSNPLRTPLLSVCLLLMCLSCKTCRGAPPANSLQQQGMVHRPSALSVMGKR